MKLHELLEQRAKKIAEMRTLQTTADTANRDLSDNERQRFDQIETEVRAINEKIERAQRLDALERSAVATPLNGGTPDFDRECRTPGLFLDAIAASAGIEGRDTGRVREISAELQRRTGRTATGIMIPTEIFQRPAHEQRVVISSTTGAGAIPTDHRGDLTVDALRAASVVDRLGATVLSNLSGNVSIPAIDTGFTSAWIAENGALSPADWDINARTLSPKHVGALTEFSRNMILQADPSVDAMATRDGARALASALDSAALVGGGANQPLGIGATVTPTTFATPTWAEGLAMIASISTANALTGSLGWAGHPDVTKKLRSTLVAASTDSRMIMSDPNNLYGYQYYDTTALVGNGSPADRGIVFGDFSSLVVGYWTGVDILANPYESTAYSKGNVQVRALLSADVALRHEESFAYAADMNAG